MERLVCSEEAQVYQFIGEDNIYFYGPAEMAMFMGSQGKIPHLTYRRVTTNSQAGLQ